MKKITSQQAITAITKALWEISEADKDGERVALSEKEFLDEALLGLAVICQKLGYENTLHAVGMMTVVNAEMGEQIASTAGKISNLIDKSVARLDMGKSNIPLAKDSYKRLSGDFEQQRRIGLEELHAAGADLKWRDSYMHRRQQLEDLDLNGGFIIPPKEPLKDTYKDLDICGEFRKASIGAFMQAAELWKQVFGYEPTAEEMMQGKPDMPEKMAEFYGLLEKAAKDQAQTMLAYKPTAQEKEEVDELMKSVGLSDLSSDTRAHLDVIYKDGELQQPPATLSELRKQVQEGSLEGGILGLKLDKNMLDMPGEKKDDDK